MVAEGRSADDVHVLGVMATVVDDAPAPYEPDTLALLEKAVALAVDV
jgi:hypothetical protein